MFEDLQTEKLPGGVLHGMRPLDEEELSTVRARFAVVPEEYIAFLSEIGVGTIGNSSFKMLSQPIAIEDIFDFLDISDVLIVGDDFAGVSFGFLSKGDFVELDSATWNLAAVDGGFSGLIREIVVDSKLDAATG